MVLATGSSEHQSCDFRGTKSLPQGRPNVFLRMPAMQQSYASGLDQDDYPWPV